MPSGGMSAMPPMNFGSPPSGEIPILFNDHHVYTKPDRLTRGRVLAALVRGGTILIPLRSMFEQMGATVSYDPGSRTADVSKPGSDVKVTVGRPEVIINGESRPLDVPPVMVNGVVMVPVRVISEGMGAYVQWVPDRRVVVVRYVPPTPPPAPPPPPPPPPPPARPRPTPTPTPTPAPPSHGSEFFVVGDYAFSPKVYNEFSPGQTGGASFAGRIGAEIPFGNLAFMVEGTGETYRYPHYGDPRFDQNGNTGANGNYDGLPSPVCSIPEPIGAGGNSGCVTVIGGNGQTFVPSFNAINWDYDGRIGIGLPFPRVFVAASYIQRFTNYGYPTEQGFGFGLEKLPDFDGGIISPYGSIYYYPQVGAGKTLQYSMYKYQIGLTVQDKSFPVFLDLGFKGDKGNAKLNAPASFTDYGAYAGLGVHF